MGQAGSGQRTSDDWLPQRAPMINSPSTWRNSNSMSASLPFGATREATVSRAPETDRGVHSGVAEVFGDPCGNVGRDAAQITLRGDR